MLAFPDLPVLSDSGVRSNVLQVQIRFGSLPMVKMAAFALHVTVCAVFHFECIFVVMDVVSFVS